MLEIKDKMFGREKECKMRKADDWRMSQIRERGFSVRHFMLSSHTSILQISS